jgi:tryptophan 7-halogenase
MNNEKERSIQNVVVVGGGTAGWLAALYLQISLPNSNIKVVESKDIGILGAGEGTVPHFISFLDYIGIPFSTLVKEADATVKNSVKFTNWTGDNSYYHHSFSTEEPFLGFDGANFDVPLNTCQTSIAVLSAVVHGHRNEDIDVMNIAGKEYKVPFEYLGETSSNSLDPFSKYSTSTYFAAHFNAAKLAMLLKNIGTTRGITLEEGTVTDIKKTDDGEVCSLTLDSGTVVDVDFIFDCTGFARMFIGKEYKSEWVSYNEYLTVDSAIPFFVPIEDNKIPAYTEAIAMKYGWMWKIPTGERYGCGYVYNSSMISEEDAAKEIEEYLGYEPIYPRKNKGSFKFEAGYYKTPWVKNCISLGLASGFIEPLEATSIWTSTVFLQSIISNVSNLAVKDERIAEEFNAKFSKMNQEVLDFLYFHYMSCRKDTAFWEHYTEDNAPESLKKTIEPWKYRMPQLADFRTDNLFFLNNWVSIYFGKNHISKSVAERTYSLNNYKETTYKNYNLLLSNTKEVVKNRFIDHYEFLKDLGK